MSVLAEERRPANEVFAQIGREAVMLVAASMRLGHTTPTMTLDYVHTEPTFITDLLAWCRGGPLAEAGRDRVEAWMDANDMDRISAEILGNALARPHPDKLGAG